MPQMTITPSFINQPKAGKKMGTVKLPDNSSLMAYPAVLNQMQPRGTYKVEYDEATESFNFRTIRKVLGTEAAAPAAAASGGGGWREDPLKQEQIFVCGIINSAIKAGKIGLTVDSMVELVTRAREVWAKTYGTKTTPAVQEQTAAPKRDVQGEYDDEIPF